MYHGEYEIVGNSEIAPGIFKMTISAKDIAKSARPGQFINISCGEARILARPISICDIEGENVVVIYQVKGKGTAFLSKLKIGQRVYAVGPLGGRGFSVKEGRKTLLIGGGIGVFPLLYAAKACGKSAVSALGFRSAAQCVLVEEFESICGEALIVSDDGSVGEKAFATDAARKLIEKEKPEIILACGPLPMLKEAAKLGKEYGIKTEVSLEERMGCGIGACLVCACKTVKDGEEIYRHVCKDGPIFDAEVIF